MTLPLPRLVAIDRGDAAGLVSQLDASTARVWLLSEGAVLASALAGLM